MNKHCLAVTLIVLLTSLSGCVTKDFSGEEGDLDSGVVDVGDTTTADAGDTGDAAEDVERDTAEDVEQDTPPTGCQTDDDCSSPDNATGTCASSGECTYTCDEGFDDCDGDAANGCEVELVTDSANCGMCGTVCEATNLGYARACSESQCQPTDTCADGRADANGDANDGCECEIISTTDAPDADGLDENCDGVDGVLEQAVFVDTNGDDQNNTGLTPDSPLFSITLGLQKAKTTGRSYLLVGGGTYPEVISLESGIGIYGGYDASNNWQRDVQSRETRIEPPDSAFPSGTEHYKTLTANGLDQETVLDHLTIVGADARTAGSSTYAVWAHQSQRLVVRNSKVIAGDAADGTDGAAGVERTDLSCNATGGTGGAETTTAVDCNSPGTAPAGMQGDDGAQTASGGAGGNGGANFCTQTLASCNTSSGGNGDNGAPGAAGSNGTPGSSYGMLDGAHWSADWGTDPDDGDNGGGGGGGGAGGDCAYIGSTGRGGAGGHGGAGGCGATAGANGTAGGGAFGLFASQSTVEVDTIEIIQGNGGAGGAGGDGGRGQTAPNTGWSGGDGARSAGGKRGGDGGYGGDGGHGGAGAGGCGGPSIGIASNESTMTVSGANYTQPAQGAAGGDGGTNRDSTVGNAPAGCTGAVETEYSFAPPSSQ